MEVVVFSDLHVHNYKNFDRNGSRLENCLKVLDDVFAFANGNDINTILFAGDIVDQQQAVPTVASNALMERLRLLFNKYPDISVIAITGNHDQGSKSVAGNAGVSYLVQLEVAFPENFRRVDDDSIHTVEDGFFVHGVPYYQHPEHFKQMLAERSKAAKETNGDYTHVLMIHQTPSGLGNPNIPIDTEVTDELYDAFDLVLCGHIHKPMKITDKFYLVGNPLHRDLGDEGDEKGFWVFDTADPVGTMEFVSRKGRYPEFKRVRGAEAAGNESDYVIPVMDAVELSDGEVETVKEFNAGLGAEELMANYCKQMSMGEETLKVGLKFIK